MPRLLLTLLACFLAGLGGLCWLGAWRHARIAVQDELYWAYHAASAVLLALAGGLLLPAGVRLVRQPQIWEAYPFLRLARFWRWLGLCGVGIFFGLGLALPGDDLARYPCRAACLAAGSLLLLPLLWPAAWAQASSRWWQTPWGKAADLAAGNLVLLVLLLEAALRLLAWYSGQDALLLDRADGYRLRPGVYGHGLRANSLGFADEEWTQPKPKGRVRIAALGDSFSVGTAVAYEDNYLTLLERELGVEVCNFGVCGTGPREYCQLLASLVWDYEPDLVLVPIFVGNDITEWIASPQLFRFHPDALYTQLLARRGVRLVREWWRGGSLGLAAGDFRMGPGPQLSEKTYLELIAGRMVVCRTPPTAEDQLRWTRVEAWLHRLIRDCRHRQVPVAFLLIPDEFQVHAQLRDKAMPLRGWKDADLDLLLPQKRLAAFCHDCQVPCLDLYPALTAFGPAAYLPNDGHFSTAGHRLAAQEVGRWLIEHFPELLGRRSPGRHVGQGRNWFPGKRFQTARGRQGPPVPGAEGCSAAVSWKIREPFGGILVSK